MFRKIPVRTLWAQTRNFEFIEICVTGQTYFILVRYTVTDSGV
jgi:hypothetical protein